MKRLALAPMLVAAIAAGPARALPVEALGWVVGTHRFSVEDGAAPAGILFGTGGPVFDPAAGLDTGVDAPDATLAVDTSSVQVGNSTVEPPIPVLNDRRRRTNRADPTEFALAETSFSATYRSDPENVLFALEQGDFQRVGLAQLRLVSEPVAASAAERYGVSRVHHFENQGPRELSFNIFGGFDVDLTAQFSGSDGFARSSTVIEWIFDGIAPADLLYVPLDTYFLSIDEAGPGATVAESLSATPSGTSGVLFSGAATAIGSGGFTEARLQAAHDFILRLTLDPGQVVTMRHGFVQANLVEYAPPDAQVPVPAPAALLAGALALLALLRRASSSGPPRPMQSKGRSR